MIEETHIERTHFVILGRSCGDHDSIHLHKVRDGKVCEQVPFTKEVAQRVFGLFDQYAYVPKSFKGIIPKNILLALDGQQTQTKLIWTVGRSRRNLKFNNKNKQLQGAYYLPNLVFRYINGVISVFALDTDKPDESSKLYHAPFYNVYSTGNVCMGNVKVGKVMSFQYFEIMVNFLENAFFTSRFTHSNNSPIDENYLTTFKKEDAKHKLLATDLTLGHLL